MKRGTEPASSDDAERAGPREPNWILPSNYPFLHRDIQLPVGVSRDAALAVTVRTQLKLAGEVPKSSPLGVGWKRLVLEETIEVPKWARHRPGAKGSLVSVRLSDHSK